MFPCSFKPVTTAAVQKSVSVLKKSQRNYKVMVAGAAGGVGQPLALLLKMNPLVSRLAMFDVIATTPGISEDVSHIDTMAQVTCHTGTNELVSALKGADVIVHAPDMARKTGSGAFEFNACVARDLANSIAQNAPKAMTVIVSNLMNTLVPIVSEVMLKAGVYDPGRIFGMTTLDAVRASVFVAQTFGMDPRTVSVPIVGGGTTNTIVPVFSQCKPSIKFRDQEQIKALTIRVREAGDKMMISKAGTASATLSMGYAAARMVDSILRGLKGQGNVVECAYVRSDVTDLKYFSNPLLLGRSGVVKNLGIGNLTEFEQQLMKEAVPELHQSIKKGEMFIKTGRLKENARYKVAVTGASGGIGQPLALLLKTNTLVTRLTLYDIAPVTPGVAVDLSHMNTPAKVTGHKGAGEMVAAIKDSDVVIIVAGLARKPGMTRDDLFKTNASIVSEMAHCVALHAPQAIVAIVTNPINSMVPVACEVMKKACAFDPARVLGVTTLDVVRAASFVAEINNIDPRCVTIPVIGGHAGITIIPLLSQCQPAVNIRDQKKIETLTKKIQEAGTTVVKAKAGGGSATLSMAYAGERITNAIMRGLRGEPNIVECAYVQSNVTQSPYFANPLLFGPCGVAKNLGHGILNGYEKQQLKAAIPELLKNVQTGEKFVHGC